MESLRVNGAAERLELPDDVILSAMIALGSGSAGADGY